MIDKIVALDLSLTCTGLVTFSTDGMKLEHDSIKTKVTDGERVERYARAARRILSYVPRTSMVFIEDFAYGARAGASSLATLGELNGVIKLLCWKKTGRIPITVPSTTIKQWLGAGNMKKDMIPVEAFKMFQKEMNTHDEYVALTLADIAYHLLALYQDTKHLRKLTAKQSSILVKLQGSKVGDLTTRGLRIK